MRKCNKCKELKAPEDYHRGNRARCKICVRKTANESYVKVRPFNRKASNGMMKDVLTNDKYLNNLKALRKFHAKKGDKTKVPAIDGLISDCEKRLSMEVSPVFNYKSF